MEHEGKYTIYLTDANGTVQELPCIGKLEAKVDRKSVKLEKEMLRVASCRGSGELSITVRYFNRLLWYGILYGMHMTNNYFKMHNGILVRKRAYKKAYENARRRSRSKGAS